MKERQAQLSERFAGLVDPSTIGWMMSDLTKVADNLNYILNCSASIQHKLTNPVISNSLPTNSSIHSALISITSLLADMSTGNDSATAASEWISNQDWDGVGGSLDINQQKIDVQISQCIFFCKIPVYIIVLCTIASIFSNCLLEYKSLGENRDILYSNNCHALLIGVEIVVIFVTGLHLLPHLHCCCQGVVAM